MPSYWACEVRQGGGNAMHERYAVMVTTRGCPHVCDFCTSPLMGGYRYYRKRPIEDIIALCSASSSDRLPCKFANANEEEVTEAAAAW